MSDVSDAERIAAAAAKRFVRWDAKLWDELCAGPGAELARAVDPRVAASYLELAAEAIGLGYLYPAAAGVDGFFTHVFGKLAPRLVPGLPPAEQAAALAALWNLGENLEQAPAWLRRIFFRLFRDLDTLVGLGAAVDDLERRALAAPAATLDGEVAAHWVALGAEDRRFLPGALHFVAPQVVCVHDRERVAAGRDTPTLGVWVTSPPVILGTMGCREELAQVPAAGPLWDRLAARDPRFSEPYAAAGNDWRAAATLVTSQSLIALVPMDATRKGVTAP